MKKSIFVNMFVMSAGLLLGTVAARSEGDAAKGARAIKPCLACHALQEGRQMTGPSLHAIMGRKAGGLAGFERYSAAIKGSPVVWTADTLNDWLANPQALIPGNRMAYYAIAEAFFAGHLGGACEPMGEDLKESSHEIRAGADVLDQLPQIGVTVVRKAPATETVFADNQYGE